MRNAEVAASCATLINRDTVKDGWFLEINIIKLSAVKRLKFSFFKDLDVLIFQRTSSYGWEAADYLDLPVFFKF